MDFEAPPAVLRALKARLGHSVLGYTRPDYELKQSILRYFQEDVSLAVVAFDLEGSVRVSVKIRPWQCRDMPQQFLVPCRSEQ
jgi:bifunctional pyridoxal-dependent enzyme with beta-cystathionase and maltose regulon repressor activities